MDAGPRDTLSEKVIGLAIGIHRALGPGLLEAVYEQCLCHDLEEAGIPFVSQVALPVVYKSLRLEGAYRIDIIVADALVLELKAVESLTKLHEAQLLTYLRMAGITTGLLINFNSAVLRDGIKRMRL
jgi:GxxExxY protein